VTDITEGPDKTEVTEAGAGSDLTNMNEESEEPETDRNGDQPIFVQRH